MAEVTKLFKAGDLAFLRSGGPCMTVTAASGKSVTCQWFDEDALCEGTFPADALKGPDRYVQVPQSD